MTFRIKLGVLLSIGRRIRETKGTSAPVTLKSFFLQYVLGFNKSCYWPVHFSSVVSGAQYIRTGIGTAPGLSHGCYIFAGKDSRITIGDYTIIAPNVCIAGYNHSVYDYRKYEDGIHTSLGRYCWIGMNANVLPGVKLGDHTVVAAGAVVTESFEQGYVIVGGNPAKIIRTIDKDKCIEHSNNVEYIGYLSLNEFRKFEHSLIESQHS